MWPWGRKARLRKEAKNYSETRHAMREKMPKSSSLYDVSRELRRQEEMKKLDATIARLEREVRVMPERVMKCPACDRLFVAGEHEWQTFQGHSGTEHTKCIDERGVVHKTSRSGTIKYTPVSEEDLEYVRRSILGEDTA